MRRTYPTEPGVAGEGGSSLDKAVPAWNCRMGRVR